MPPGIDTALGALLRSVRHMRPSGVRGAATRGARAQDDGSQPFRFTAHG